MTADSEMAVQVIDRAMELIATPKQWIKKAFCTTALGDRVRFMDPDAACFCLYGAMERAISEFKFPYAIYVRIDIIVWKALYKQTSRDITYFNDRPTTTHADVIAALAKTRAEVTKKS